MATEKNNTNIGYQGTVIVTVKKGKKIISKKEYHNKGGEQLFNFLSLCVAKQNAIANRAPAYICLFHTDETKMPSPDYDINIKTGEGADTLVSKVQLVSEGTVDNQNRAHLFFTIPCTFITEPNIYKAALYNYNTIYSNDLDQDNIYKNYCAEFTFEKDKQWDPLQVKAMNGDFSLYIDWIMSFSDKNV